MYDGFSYRFTPIRNKITTTDAGIVDVEGLYRKMTQVFSWDALSRTDWFVDYQNYYTFLGVLSQRQIFLTTANALMKAGQNGRALEMLDKCQEVVKLENFPLETIAIGLSNNDYMVIQMVSAYYKLGAAEKARSLAVDLSNELLVSARFFLEFYDVAHSDFELCGNYIYYLADEMTRGGDKELADQLTDRFQALIRIATGQYEQAAAPEGDSLTIAK